MKAMIVWQPRAVKSVSVTVTNAIFCVQLFTDETEVLLAAVMVLATGPFGWMAFSAMERKWISPIVGTEDGAMLAVDTVMTYPSHV